jgi:phage host-nuclease inhibitor protein Gam
MGEAARGLTFKTEHHMRSEDLLADLRREMLALKSTVDIQATERDKMAERHKAAISPIKDRIAKLDKELRKYARKHKLALFEGGDRLDLLSGALLRQDEEHVKRARGVLDELQRLGLTEAIRTNPQVDWDVLEKWSDERLIEVGAERVPEETFAYELFGVQK